MRETRKCMQRQKIYITTDRDMWSRHRFFFRLHTQTFWYWVWKCRHVKRFVPSFKNKNFCRSYRHHQFFKRKKVDSLISFLSIQALAINNFFSFPAFSSHWIRKVSCFLCSKNEREFFIFFFCIKCGVLFRLFYWLHDDWKDLVHTLKNEFSRRFY